MKKYIVLVLFLMLVACSSSQITATKTATPIPPSFTSTPSETIEPIPQEYNDLQEKIAQTDNFILNEGMIEQVAPYLVVERISVSKQTGEITLQQDDQEISLDPKSLSFNETGFTIKTIEGKTLSWNGKELKELKPAESDLRIGYEQEVNETYMGVVINASLITDLSLDPTIKKITMNDRAYAEFIARSVFKVWWTKGNEKQSGSPKEEDFKNFMTLWSTAQNSGLEEGWRKVQVNEVWANDVQTEGYDQDPYTMWFGYEGDDAPQDVKPISKFSIAIVKANKMKNITMFSNNEHNEGAGTNLDERSLVISYGATGLIFSVKDPEIQKFGIAGHLSDTSWWLKINNGGGHSGYNPTSNRGLDDTAKKLLTNGLKVYR